MSLQSFYKRFVGSDDPDPNALPVVDFGGVEDHEMETVVTHRPATPASAQAPRPKNGGFVALLGFAPGALLTNGLLNDSEADADEQVSAAVRAYDNPTNGHAVMRLLYELEYADLILYVVNMQQGLTSDHIRWINRLQEMRVPLVVLVNGATPSGNKQQRFRLQQMERQINRPLVPVSTNDAAASRRALVETLYHVSPRLAAMLSIHLPLLRPVLAEHMLSNAVHSSMDLDTDVDQSDLSALAEAQVRLIRQITAAYGRGTRLTRREYQGMVSMVNAVSGYTSELVDNLPAMKPERRARLSKSVSTLLVGYITMVYHGETPPEVRKELLPQVWRLYRATGQMAEG